MIEKGVVVEELEVDVLLFFNNWMCKGVFIKLSILDVWEENSLLNINVGERERDYLLAARLWMRERKRLWVRTLRFFWVKGREE